MCCFGDILAEAMKARGCAGVVVDGGIRDIAFLRNLGLPMMARYCSPASSRDRWRVVEKQAPVQVRGALIDWITVYPGDIIVADDDGVIVVPKLLVEDVTIRVRKWSKEDSESREDVRRGVRLLEVIEKYGHL
jgi:regulator of RNase E activity RraA